MQKFLSDNYDLILSICKGISVNYEDLAHDTILKLVKYPNIVDLNEVQRKVMIFKIAKNTHLDNLRKEQVRLKINEKDLDFGEVSRDPYEYILKIRNSKLTEIERLWIEIYLDYGDFKEISKHINVSRQTISKYVCKSLKKLKRS